MGTVPAIRELIRSDAYLMYLLLIILGDYIIEYDLFPAEEAG